MTTTSTRPETTEAAAKSVSPAAAITVLALTAVLGLAALLGPNLAASDLGMAMSMGMTHYMELLAANQPWNLLLFMGAPVVLAETLAITELVLLFQREAAPEWVRRTSRIAGLLAGLLVHETAILVSPWLNTRTGWTQEFGKAVALIFIVALISLGITSAVIAARSRPYFSYRYCSTSSRRWCSKSTSMSGAS